MMVRSRLRATVKMSTQRIVFALLGATLCLSAAVFGSDSTEDYEDTTTTTSSTENVQSVYPERVGVFPDQSVTVYKWNSLAFRMTTHYENLTSCIATLPNNRPFDVLNDKATHIRKFDQCGVIVITSENQTGEWRLEATVGGDKKYYGNISVVVLPDRPFLTHAAPLHVLRGSPFSITVGPSSATSCQFRNPLGELLPKRIGNCHMNISSANNAVAGTWDAFYSLPGEFELLWEQILVTIYDKSAAFNATVTTSENGEIHLLCRVRSASASLCQFTAPYPETFDVMNGTGKSRYIQYGSGIKSEGTDDEQIHECGLTILEPDAEDYGTWKCIVGTDSGLTGSILKVYKKSTVVTTLTVKPEKYEVYAMKGNSFTIKCNADAVLKSCWMRSPSGKAYAVSTSGTSSNSLEYFGMGLSLGECGAVIPVAKDADEGKWQCEVGLPNGINTGTQISVTVTDTVLVPGARNVTANPYQTHLSCYIPTEFGHTIDHCMWMGPDGQLQPGWNYERYVVTETNSSCHLTIKWLERTKDIGEWTCAASLVGSSETPSNTIEVLAPGGSGSGRRSYTFYMFMLLVLSIGMICLTSMFAVIIRAKIQTIKSRLDPPPKYDERNIGMPPPVQPYSLR